MEDNKYYTPEIEELINHMTSEGYVYGIVQDTPRKMIYGSNITNRVASFITGTADRTKNGYVLNPEMYLLKYLDQEDIESCGWKRINDNYYTFNDTHELYMLDNHRLLIKEILTESNMNKRLDNPHTVYYHLFDGTIKNLSVLKQVLKMIGVE